MSTEHSPAQDTRRYLAERQAADYIGLSDKTLQRHRANGTGPQFIKTGTGRGGRILYDRHDCDTWMEEHKVQSTSAYAGRQHDA